MNATYSIIVVDDEKPTLEIVEWYIKQSPNLKLEGTFVSPEKALEYLSKKVIDIVILDIEMIGMNGLDLARNLKGKSKIIFSTAFSNHAIEGYNLSAVDYLLKPYSSSRFNQAIEKAISQIEYERIKLKEQDTIVVTINYQKQVVPLLSIDLIESSNNNIQFHLSDGSILDFRDSLSNIQQRLPQNDFFKIHRSFIVPKSKISSFTSQYVVIGTKKIPISKSFKNDFIQWIGINKEDNNSFFQEENESENL